LGCNIGQSWHHFCFFKKLISHSERNFKMITSATTTADLVEFYNLNVPAAKRVSRFSDRKTAERRCTEIFDRLDAEAAVKAAEAAVKAAKKGAQADSSVTGFADHGHSNCPGCGAHLSNGVAVDGDDVNGKPLRNDTHLYECMACGEGFGKQLRRAANSSTRSAAITKSWTDTSVAMARAQRTSVRVFDGFDDIVGEYKSVAYAFRRLGFPMNKHIAFRMALKAAGCKTFAAYTFKIVA